MGAAGAGPDPGGSGGEGGSGGSGGIGWIVAAITALFITASALADSAPAKLAAAPLDRWEWVNFGLYALAPVIVVLLWLRGVIRPQALDGGRDVTPLPWWIWLVAAPTSSCASCWTR